MRLQVIMVSVLVGLACLVAGVCGSTYAQGLGAVVPIPPIAVIADDIAFGWKFVSALLGLIGVVLTFLAGEVWNSVRKLTTDTVPMLSADFRMHAAVTAEKFDQADKDSKIRSERLGRVEDQVTEAVAVAKESAQYVQAVAYRMGVATSPASQDLNEPSSPTASKIRRERTPG